MRRQMLRERARRRKELAESKTTGLAGSMFRSTLSAVKQNQPTGIKSWDRLLRLKSNRKLVPMYGGRFFVLAAPGQYVKGMKVR